MGNVCDTISTKTSGCSVLNSDKKQRARWFACHCCQSPSSANSFCSACCEGVGTDHSADSTFGNFCDTISTESGGCSVLNCHTRQSAGWIARHCCQSPSSASSLCSARCESVGTDHSTDSTFRNFCDTISTETSGCSVLNSHSRQSTRWFACHCCQNPSSASCFCSACCESVSTDHSADSTFGNCCDTISTETSGCSVLNCHSRQRAQWFACHCCQSPSSANSFCSACCESVGTDHSADSTFGNFCDTISTEARACSVLNSHIRQ